jgi:hypothetical protein
MMPFSMNMYWSDQQKKYTSKKLRPNTIRCAFYINGVQGLAKQFGLENPTVRELGQEKA